VSTVVYFAGPILVAVALCVVAAISWLDREIDRIPRTKSIDEQVAAFAAELNAFEEANRG
jgi:hypothetical protein